MYVHVQSNDHARTNSFHCAGMPKPKASTELLYCCKEKKNYSNDSRAMENCDIVAKRISQIVPIFWILVFAKLMIIISNYYSIVG